MGDAVPNTLWPYLRFYTYNADNRREVTTEGFVLDLPADVGAMLDRVPAVAVSAFNERFLHRLSTGPRPGHVTHGPCAGFTIDLWFRLAAPDEWQVPLDNRPGTGKGFVLQAAERGTREIVLNDERTESRWNCDGVLEARNLHHAAVIVDGGSKFILFIIDGVLHDGGAHRSFGWGRFNPQLRNVPGSDLIRTGPTLEGRIERFRICDRYLRIFEVIANYRSSPRCGRSSDE